MATRSLLLWKSAVSSLLSMRSDTPPVVRTCGYRRFWSQSLYIPNRQNCLCLSFSLFSLFSWVIMTMNGEVVKATDMRSNQRFFWSVTFVESVWIEQIIFCVGGLARGLVLVPLIRQHLSILWLLVWITG